MGTAKATRCLCLDDHAVVRQGINLLFCSLDDLELLGTVETGEDALAAIRKHKPEVVLVDVRLPGVDGISVLRKIQSEAPAVKTVVFSAYGDKRLLTDAIAAGARGYVMKGSPPEDLLRAIRTVMEGKPFVDPSLSPTLLTGNGTEGNLSEREREILQLLAGGLHTNEVAERIGLSPETVKADTKRAITKLEADGRVHAVAIALRQSMIE